VSGVVGLPAAPVEAGGKADESLHLRTAEVLRLDSVFLFLRGYLRAGMVSSQGLRADAKTGPGGGAGQQTLRVIPMPERG